MGHSEHWARQRRAAENDGAPARREAAAALQADAEVVLLRSGVRAVLGAQRVRLAALPLQVYPVHYAAFPTCARTLDRAQPCPCKQRAPRG